MPRASCESELDQDLYTGVEELHGLSKTTIDGRQFYYFETRKGVEQHEVLATELNGYVLAGGSGSQRSPNGEVAGLGVQSAQVLSSPGGDTARRSQAVAYEGPAVSSQRLRELKASPPAETMDPGRIAGNVYLNAQIGMRYELPKGWNIQPQGAVEPAVLRYREKVSGEPNMGPRERDVVKACRRTLFSAWKTKPGADGEVPYDEFGEVTLSAMPLACFPNIHFPDDPHDVDGVRRFLVGFSFSHPLQRDMNDARTFEAGGKTLVLTHGTIAYKEAGDTLIAADIGRDGHDSSSRIPAGVAFRRSPRRRAARAHERQDGLRSRSGDNGSEGERASNPEKTPAPGGIAHAGSGVRNTRSRRASVRARESRFESSARGDSSTSERSDDISSHAAEARGNHAG